MTKYVKVTFSNGDKFKIPATTIAHERAKHFASSDVEDEKSAEWIKVYEEERKITLDDYELKDWLFNNMDWKDVAEDVLKVDDKETKYDYSKHWLEITEDDDNCEVVNE